MSTWRIVFAVGGGAYLVHVDSDSKKTALHEAEKKARREYGAEDIRVKSAERVIA